MVQLARCHAGGLLDLQAISDVLDSDQIGALGLDVQWQEPWDPTHCITTHPKSVIMLPDLHAPASRPSYCGSWHPLAASTASLSLPSHNREP